MSRYAANLRVVNHDDGSSRLAEMKRLFALAAEERERRHAQAPVSVEEAREQYRRVEAGSEFPARQKPGSVPLRDVARPVTHPVTADEALQNAVEVRTAAVQGASHGQGDGGLESPQGAPLCRVGPRIYMRHTLGDGGRCELCDWQYPALTLNGRGG